MATLPENTINISQGVVFENYPSKTWYVNPITKQVSDMVDGYQAIVQAVEILFSVERFWWQIYSPNFGVQWQGLIGLNPGFVGLEIQRRAKDAIKPDSRLLDITDFSYTVNRDSLTAQFIVKTVYGDVPQTVTLT